MNVYTSMTPYEFNRSRKFRKKHRKCKRRIDYMVYTSAIGQSIHIICRGCNKEKDITDYGCW